MNEQKLYEKAKKIAFQKKCSTNQILKPLLVKHGFEDENGYALKTICIQVGLTENLDQIPTEEK
tara:strand:+ start:813 stop:1004 length:192 start_codon:yes stop_codon:yes gene_type:complete